MKCYSMEEVAEFKLDPFWYRADEVDALIRRMRNVMDRYAEWNDTWGEEQAVALLNETEEWK